MMTSSWQSTLVVGVLTLILGIIVSFHPTGSLNVIAVLFGVLMILSGIFHLIRVFDPEELNRVWAGISGLLFIVIGVILIRHLHLTRALIGLFIGITWIVQGLGAIIGRSGRRRPWGQGLVDRFRAGQHRRRDRGRGHPDLLPQRPGRTARYLVHHHGHLRDRRGIHAPSCAAPCSDHSPGGSAGARNAETSRATSVARNTWPVSASITAMARPLLPAAVKSP